MTRAPKPLPLLTEKDAQAWQAETQSIRPLKNRGTPAPLPRLRATVAPKPVLPDVAAAPSSRPLLNATLDATWDRKMRTGELVPDMILDLHGSSQAQAFQKLHRAIPKAVSRHARLVLVITGKGEPDPETWPAPDPRRGILRQAFPAWIQSADLAPFVASVRPAHKRHGGSGAWYVVLKRSRR